MNFLVLENQTKKNYNLQSPKMNTTVHEPWVLSFDRDLHFKEGNNCLNTPQLWPLLHQNFFVYPLSHRGRIKHIDINLLLLLQVILYCLFQFLISSVFFFLFLPVSRSLNAYDQLSLVLWLLYSLIFTTVFFWV